MIDDLTKDDFDKYVTSAKPRKTREYRTDRNNNPIAAAVTTGGKNQFTEALDKAEIQWEHGDPFPGNAKLSTIRIKGDPYEGARAILGNSNALKWYRTTTGKKILPKYGVRSSADFLKLPIEHQDDIINGIYQSEGGNGAIKPAQDDFDKYVSRGTSQPQTAPTAPDDDFDKFVVQQPKTEKITSEVRPVEFEGGTPQEQALPSAKPIEFKQGNATPRKAGPTELMMQPFDQAQPSGSVENQLTEQRYKTPPSTELAQAVKISFSPHLNPTEDDLVKGYLNALGPEYAKFGEKYKQETGRNILSLQPGDVDRDPDGSVFVKPTRAAVDVLNAYVKSGGDINAAKAEGARIAGERRGAVTTAEQQAAPDIAEVEAARMGLGTYSGTRRAIESPVIRYGAGKIQQLGGLLSGLGIAPNKLSDALNTRGKIMELGSSLPPLTPKGEEIKRSVPEKVGTALSDLGLGVFDIIALKRVTGLSTGQVMALEAALKDSDKPLPQRGLEVAKAYTLGKILDGHLNRAMSSAMFAIPTGVESAQQVARGQMSKEDAILNTAVQGGVGAILAGGKPEGLTELGLREGVNETQTQPNVAPQPESAQPSVVSPRSADTVAVRPDQRQARIDDSDVGTLQGQPRHVDLQQRYVKGAKAGDFKKETKAQAAARQAQVNPEQPNVPQVEVTAKPVSRNFRAGPNEATLTFASETQRDLYDAGARLRKGEGQTRGVSFAPTKDPQIDAIAARLGVDRQEVVRRAMDTHKDVRTQMKGVKDGETRAVKDNVNPTPPSEGGVSKHPFTTVQAAQEFIRALPNEQFRKYSDAYSANPPSKLEWLGFVNRLFGESSGGVSVAPNPLASSPEVLAKTRLGSEATGDERGQLPATEREMVNRQEYYRGTRPGVKYGLKGDDRFYSSDPSVAQEYAGENGTVEKIAGGELPANLYVATNKGSLRHDLGISDLFGEKDADREVRRKLQAQGYDGVRYRYSIGDGDEIHVFPKSETETKNLVAEATGIPSSDAIVSLLENEQSGQLYDRIKDGTASEADVAQFRKLADEEYLSPEATEDLIASTREGGVQETPEIQTEPAVQSQTRPVASRAAQAAQQPESREAPTSPAASAKAISSKLSSMKVLPTEAETPKAETVNRQGEEPLPQKGVPVKTAAIEQERAEAGLNPVEKQQYRNIGESYFRGKDAVEKGGVDPRTLAAEVAKTERPLTADEIGALGYDRARLQNEYDAKMAQLSSAVDKGDAQGVASHRAELEEVERLADLNDTALEKGGREQSIAFNARKMIVGRDYSLLGIIQRAKAAKGEKLNDAERGKYETLQKQYAEAEKKIAAYESSKPDRALKRIISETERQARREKRNVTRQELDTEFAQLKTAFAQARSETKSVQPSGLAGIDPEGKLTKIVSQMARNRVLAGFNTVEGLVDELHSQLKDFVDDKRAVRDLFSGYGKEPKPKTKDDITVELNRLKREAQKLSREEDKNPVTEAAKLEAFKQKTVRTRLTKQIADLERRLKEKNYTKPQRKPLEYDREAEQLLAHRDLLKNRIETEIAKGKKPLPEDYLTWWQQGTILSGTRTLAKLGSYALGKNVIIPIEDVISGGMSHIPGLRGLSKASPRYGGGIRENVEAQAAAFKEFVNKAMYRDAWTSLKEGTNALKLKHGDQRYQYAPRLLTFIRGLHMAEKVFASRPEYYRAIEKEAKWAIRNGLNPEDPKVQSQILSRSYMNGLRAQLMQPSIPSKMLSTTNAWLESVGKTGKVGQIQEPGIKGVARAARLGIRTLFPITRVPFNYVNEALSYNPAGGFTKGGLRLGAEAIKTLRAKGIGKGVVDLAQQGMSNMPPEAADAAKRALVKGTLGIPFALIGWYNYQNIGGYYQPGQRKEGDVPFGGLRIGGYDIPRALVHNPLFETMHFFATMRRVYEGEKDGGSVRSALKAAAKGGTEEVPFVDTIQKLSKAYEQKEGPENLAGEIARSAVVPPDLQRVAAMSDSSEPTTTAQKALQITGLKDVKTVPRQPTGFAQRFMMGVPGLRQKVPINEQKVSQQRKQSFQDRFLKGKITESDLDRAAKKSELTQSEIDSILKEKDIQNEYNPAQAAFYKSATLTPNKTSTSLERYERMTPRMRAEVKDIMQDKADAILDSDSLTELQKKAFAERIKKVGLLVRGWKEE